MNRVEACNYLRSSGFSEEQIKVIEGAFTCEDAISRKEAISIASIATLSVNQVVMALEKLPPVNPQEPKTGHWIYKNYNWHCSECDETPKTLGYVGDADFMKEHFKFCNHCGAKMESEGKE